MRPDVDIAVNTLPEGGEAFEGHDVDRIIEVESEPIAFGITAERLHTEHGGYERLAEVKAFHP